MLALLRMRRQSCASTKDIECAAKRSQSWAPETRGAGLFTGPRVAGVVTHLGYPVYILTILGVWKVPGAIVIVAPCLPRLKEWAYAGIVFELTGAVASYALRGEITRDIIAPLILAALAMASWALRAWSNSTDRLGLISLNRPSDDMAAVITPGIFPPAADIMRSWQGDERPVRTHGDPYAGASRPKPARPARCSALQCVQRVPQRRSPRTKTREVKR